LILRFHAAARELAGTSEDEIDIGDQALDEAALRKRIAAAYPALAPYLPRMRFACNDAFSQSDQVYSSGDAVDIMPPVAGGAPTSSVVHCSIRHEALSGDEMIAAVADPAAGATASFLGVVRNHHQGQAIQRLEYEAHPTLAAVEMRRVLELLASEFEGVRIAAVHRVGSLEVGDVAVVVAVSSAHRAEAFDVCRAAIDRIKETVPIWKKEWGVDNISTWVNL
jgi:molybdopterin synthase catalytic subunit/molybdopterin converting factor small subunit